MTYEELKKRIKDEELDKYAFIDFDTLLGPEYTLCIDKESDGTVSYVRYGERNKILSESRNKPEEEICEWVYDYAVSRKKFELACQEQLHQMKDGS